MVDVVVVSSETTKNLYYLSPGDIDLKVGDNVVFETDNGLLVGSVRKEKYQENNKNLDMPLFKVLRLVNKEDQKA